MSEHGMNDDLTPSVRRNVPVSSLACALFLMLTAACSLGMSSTLSEPVLREAVDVPARFVFDLSTPADTTPGEGCRSPLHDPRDSTRIVMVRSTAERADYDVPAGRYGVIARELLRVSCNTGEPVGIVRR